ncbi:hypothetical protein IFM89_028310 [Coptis chinensis]|uniref:DUF4283 domain-containing protein n=1 Tax=Coptis chinensis TaxID=261450 RepID=A0A835I265_9MAGN|nr:hypothetical protein IFM89_028310 [Coptis chinensis]
MEPKTEVTYIVVTQGNLFIISFENEIDKNKILKNEPWQIMGYLLVLKKFSLHLSPQQIAFDTALFWITFTGLQLEHQSPEVIKLLAAAAGTFREVDPAENAPRMAAGYRARVEVDLHKPLSQGTMTETLYKGPTWVGFEYSSVPFHSCKKCFRFTHDTAMCNEAPPTVTELLRITTIGGKFQQQIHLSGKRNHSTSTQRDNK